jgi:hypothetical protein
MEPEIVHGVAPDGSWKVVPWYDEASDRHEDTEESRACGYSEEVVRHDRRDDHHQRLDLHAHARPHVNCRQARALKRIARPRRPIVDVPFCEAALPVRSGAAAGTSRLVAAVRPQQSRASGTGRGPSRAAPAWLPAAQSVAPRVEVTRASARDREHGVAGRGAGWLQGARTAMSAEKRLRMKYARRSRSALRPAKR